MAAPDDIKTVIGLFRVSTEEQEQEGNSLEAQKRMYDWDCPSFKWKSLGVFSGQETGTALSSRKIIYDVMDALREHRPDALWVREQSRLTRGDQLDVAVLLRELRENSILVVTERGHVLDLTDVEGEFLFGLKALIDRGEFQVIRRRSILGKDEKARRGLCAHGRVAYGYMTTGEGRDRGLRVPHKDEAPVVRLIFELAAQGRTLGQVARELFERKIQPPATRGRAAGRPPEWFKDGFQPWAQGTIRQILNNPIYLGVSYRNCWVRRGKSEVFDPHNPKAIWIENAHEPLATQALWDAAHEQVKARAAQKKMPAYMLTGILRCPLCGSGVFGTGCWDRNRAVKQYYVCGSKRNKTDIFGRRKRNGAACSCRYLPRAKTDRLMWEALVDLVSRPDIILEYLESGGSTVRRERLVEEVAALRKQRAFRERKINVAREKLLTEVFTDGEYLTVKNQLENEIRTLDHQVQVKETEAETCSAEATQQLVHNLAMLRLGDRKLSEEQRRGLFRTLVKRVSPQDETLQVCEIELNAGIAPQLVEAGSAGHPCMWPENISSV